jgi:hypothetical protein
MTNCTTASAPSYCPTRSCERFRRAEGVDVAVGLPRYVPLQGAGHQSRGPLPPARDRGAARRAHRHVAERPGQARNLPHLPPLRRHAPPRARPRHPHDPGAPRPPRRGHDHDLHPHPPARGEGVAESPRPAMRLRSLAAYRGIRAVAASCYAAFLTRRYGSRLASNDQCQTSGDRSWARKVTMNELSVVRRAKSDTGVKSKRGRRYHSHSCSWRNYH